MSADQPVIAIDAVTKRFGSYVAVNNVSITVQKGEVFGFLGPNGAGKSTTIRLLLDVLRPDSGSIHIFGESNRASKKTHAKIGFLSGDMAIDNDLTGEQYLAFINHLYGGGHEARIAELASLLQAKLTVKIGNYSRGNKQKIGLIAALLHQPELLILDEPTSGFDPLVQETFAGLVREFTAHGGTVFMSSHILAEVQQLCDRVAFIKEGTLVETKSIHELMAVTAKRVHITAPARELAALKRGHHGVHGLQLTSETATELIFTYHGKPKALLNYLAPHNIDNLTIHEPDLEEIFSHYYEGDVA